MNAFIRHEIEYSQSQRLGPGGLMPWWYVAVLAGVGLGRLRELAISAANEKARPCMRARPALTR